MPELQVWYMWASNGIPGFSLEGQLLVAGYLRLCHRRHRRRRHPPAGGAGVSSPLSPPHWILEQGDFQGCGDVTFPSDPKTQTCFRSDDQEPDASVARSPRPTV